MDFKEYTIEECCEILNYLRFPLNSEQRFEMKGEFPYYGANGVQGYINKWKFDDDLILIAEDGGNFEQYTSRPIAYRVKGKCWVNNHAHVLKSKNEFSQDFIFYSLEHKDILFYIAGGTRSKLTQGELKKITISHPDKIEANRIGEIIKTNDEAIAHTEALIAKYQRIKIGLMQDLLTRGIDENDTIRSKETHKFKESKLGKIPVEWDVVSVGSLCKEIVVGIVIKPTQYYIESGIPMLRSFNIKEGAIEMRDLVYMSNLDNERLSKSKLKEGDVVSVRTGYPGTTAIITKEIEGCNCIDLVISRVNTAILNPNFLVTWINSHLAKRQILNQQGGNAQQHFNVGQMKELLIYKIPLEEQNRILNLVKIEEDKTINSKLHLSKLQSLKTGLMQDLLSGKVKIKIDNEN